MKACSKCGEVKSLDEFFRQPSGKMGRHSWCKPCWYAGRGPRPNNAEARRSGNLRRRYGLTPDDVSAMLAAQGGRCAICKEPPKRKVVDHDHATGRPRGILCHRCNVALAHVENLDFRRKALRYLRSAR